jgi:hypothetical protein
MRWNILTFRKWLEIISPFQVRLLLIIYYHSPNNIIHCFLATSASVERIFSGGTDLVVQRRCSLHGETIQKFMCLRGWWKSELGKGTYNNMEME